MKLQRNALDILEVALKAVTPEVLVHQHIRREDQYLRVQYRSFDLSAFHNTYVIGFGKASGHMAAALEPLLGDRLTSGIVVIPYGYKGNCRTVKEWEAGHPIPDEEGLRATSEILTLVNQAETSDLVICLISGGGSTLLEQFPPQLPLAAMQTATRVMLESGITIQELNTIRKHLSLVKGGKLAAAIEPAHCLNLIISDVIGDPVNMIASGPTAPDASTVEDAWRIIDKYKLKKKLPAEVLQVLREDLAGNTIKADHPLFHQVQDVILGNNMTALIAAEQAARRLGYHPLILSSRIQGESRQAAKVIAAILQGIVTTGHPIRSPACILFGGETTVTVTGSGKGGRNQEFVLSALIELRYLDHPFALLSCGSDGQDGPTDAAGAIITEATWEKAQRARLHPATFLNNNDAYHFFEPIDGLIRTGPTGTNVMDIGIALIP